MNKNAYSAQKDGCLRLMEIVSLFLMIVKAMILKGIVQSVIKGMIWIQESVYTQRTMRSSQVIQDVKNGIGTKISVWSVRSGGFSIRVKNADRSQICVNLTIKGGNVRPVFLVIQ